MAEDISRIHLKTVWGRAPRPFKRSEARHLLAATATQDLPENPSQPVCFASGQTVVTTSATKMPSETSRNRCHPVIHGACARGTSKMMLSVIPAKRYAPPTRSTHASIPHARIPEPYTKVLVCRNVASTIPTTAPSAVPTNRCQPKVIGAIVDCTITIAEIGAQ
jgi:hypothetical protein